MSGKPAQATTRKSEILNTKDDGKEVQKDDGEETKDDDEVNVPQTVPDDDEGEDIQPIRKPIIPVKPNALEVEDHRKLHLPYRSWCEECVMGRGLGEQRDSHGEGEHRVPRVGIDYWYITSGSLKKLEELGYGNGDDGKAKLLEDRKAGTVVKCLIVRCHETKNVFAHVVPCKGADEDNYVVDLVTSDVAWLGHVKLLLKSDNERALVTLVTRALQAIRCNVEAVESVSKEHSQEYDSQSNGGTEVGIRAV